MNDTGKTLICIWALIMCLLLGFLFGEMYMESHCSDYGKFVDGQTTYICEKQK